MWLVTKWMKVQAFCYHRRMTEDQKRRIATYRTAWKTLNKAHTLLMAEPATKKLAADVFSTLLKLNDIIEHA